MRNRANGPIRAALLTIGLVVAACTAEVRSTVPMPIDAPVDATTCGWPADTTLAFAHWVDEPGQAGLPATFPIVSGQRAFVLVTDGRNPREACVWSADGRVAVGPIPDDWQPPRP